MPVHERTNYYYPPSDVCSRYLMTLLYTFNVLLKEKNGTLDGSTGCKICRSKSIRQTCCFPQVVAFSAYMLIIITIMSCHSSCVTLPTQLSLNGK